MHRGAPSFSAFADNVAFAQNKQHLSIWNPADSRYAIELHRMLGYNLQLSAVTGVNVRMEVKRISTLASGTDIAPVPYNSGLLTFPSSIKVQTGGTVTEGSLCYAFSINNDEVAITNANGFGSNRIEVFTAPEDITKGILLPGEGLTLKQITNSVIGAYGWQLVFDLHKL